jgi:hypothetical protein
MSTHRSIPKLLRAEQLFSIAVSAPLAFLIKSSSLGGGVIDFIDSFFSSAVRRARNNHLVVVTSPSRARAAVARTHAERAKLQGPGFSPSRRRPTNKARYALLETESPFSSCPQSLVCLHDAKTAYSLGVEGVCLRAVLQFPCLDW